MLDFKKRLSAWLLVFALIFGVFNTACGFAEDAAASQNLEEEKIPDEIADTDEIDVDTFENYVIDQTAKMLNQTYKFDSDAKDVYRNALRMVLAKNPELLDDALKGVFSNLDEHSEYFTKEEYDSFVADIANEYFGIGVIVVTHEKGLSVMSVIKNSPASGAGVRKYDVITSVNGTSIEGKGIEEAKSYILGEKGTEVVIDVLRDGEVVTLSMKRDVVSTESGFYNILEDNIGYISLYSFDGHSSEFINQALKAFDEKNITKIIFDLRDNPGGSLEEYVKMGNMFFPQGPIISFEYKDEKKNSSLYSTLKKPKYDVIALVNGMSASAAEAFAGAVQDTNVGIVLGTKSYGKGTKQLVSRIISGGGVRLTDAEYLTAGGRHINGIGIIPDVEVENYVGKYDKKYYSPLLHDRVLRIGDKGEDVRCFKERLDALGFNVEIPNDEFDENMFYAVMDFQSLTGLYPYGVLDFTTQLKIEDILKSLESVEVDTQFNKAVEIFKNGSTKDYMKKLEK
ncbi:MAG: PDZ domain-containing protein [Ruminococcaceae bacterium]|nr:PDZ domain-containing protein [Oscillospiraceae bacterium]